MHLLEEMATEVEELSARLGRPLTLVAESDLNDPTLVTPRRAGGHGLDAQWSDDFHHALHVALTGETHGYYADFEPLGALAKVCERGFFHDGTWSSFREREHGVPIDPDVVPPWRLVVCSQNHDQVGNRAAGDRLTAALDDDQLACAALVTLCSPFTPMLFQGEEWAASTPFQFFTSHTDPEIGRATSEGRLTEFARHGWDPDAVPDPQDEATYHRSKLDWDERRSPRGERMLSVYRRLTALRARASGADRAGVRRVHGGRGDAGVHDAPWCADRRRELRRAGADRRRPPPSSSSRPSQASTSRRRLGHVAAARRLPRPLTRQSL